MTTNLKQKWSDWKDLNFRLFAPQANALPDCATASSEGEMKNGRGDWI